MIWKCPPLNLFNWSNLWKWKESMRPDGNGKGDKPRPKSVPLEQFDSNWDSIFKKKDKDESSTGHRDEQQSQQDMAGSN